MPARSSPDKFLTRVRKPTDFDDYWNDVLIQASAVPMEAEVNLDELRSSEDVDVYEVFFNSVDHVRIAGWYCVPKNIKNKVPAMLEVPGYQMEPPIPKNWARKGYAAFSVAPRGKLRSNNQFNPGYPGLLTHNIVDRNTYSYRGFYVDTWRAVDFLLRRPEVDARRIGVYGNSQGGGLTITTAAMRQEIAAAAAGAPYLCGFIDAIDLTSTYPYQEINDYLRINSEAKPKVEENLAYFDGINFADKINCPIVVNIGLQDNVCPPETGYALYNRIESSDRKLYPYDGHGHDAGRVKHAAIVDQFFQNHLRP